MRRTVSAVYIELWELRLYCRKHHGIAQCLFDHVSQRFGEAKSMWI